jgi:undecaprenyl diphosphate synthase
MKTLEQEQLIRFNPEDLAKLDSKRIPYHIAFIPDGNRRWAKKRLSSTQQGHKVGADTLMDTVKAALDLGVKEVTFYGFSTENWSRPAEEVNALMALYTHYLLSQRDDMVLSGIQLEVIGNLDALPPFLLNAIAEVKDATKHCDKIRLILALNYGSRDEICRAVKKIMSDVGQGKLSENEVTEKTISQYLDTGKCRDPELLIRTSGEMRVSNFLLWQISYTEIHVSPVLWPDFKPQHLLEAIVDYQARERRMGGTG